MTKATMPRIPKTSGTRTAAEVHKCSTPAQVSATQHRLVLAMMMKLPLANVFSVHLALNGKYGTYIQSSLRSLSITSPDGTGAWRKATTSVKATAVIGRFRSAATVSRVSCGGGGGVHGQNMYRQLPASASAPPATVDVGIAMLHVRPAFVHGMTERTRVVGGRTEDAVVEAALAKRDHVREDDGRE